MTRLSATMVVAAAAWLGSPGASMAGDVPRPAGAVILTVAGKIGHANRGTVDPVRDGLLAHHDMAFERALELDRAMLAGLKQGTVRAVPHNFKGAVAFSGPFLAEIFRLAGATPKTARFMALDGYVAELTAEEIAGKAWILALEADGRLLALGGPEPAWLMHASATGPQVSEAEGKRWIWAVFYIEVE